MNASLGRCRCCALRMLVSMSPNGSLIASGLLVRSLVLGRTLELASQGQIPGMVKSRGFSWLLRASKVARTDEFVHAIAPQRPLAAHIPVNVTEDMIGHEFGEFAPILVRTLDGQGQCVPLGDDLRWIFRCAPAHGPPQMLLVLRLGVHHLSLFVSYPWL